MDDTTEQNHMGTSEMKRHRIPPPSQELKQRILGAARDAWAETTPEPVEISWVYPVLRLAACLAISVSLIYLANTLDRCTTNHRMAVERSHYLDTMPDVLPNLDIRLRFAAAAASLPSKDAAQKLIERQRRIREMLSKLAGLNG